MRVSRKSKIIATTPSQMIDKFEPSFGLGQHKQMRILSFTDLERNLGYTFKREALLREALTHKSAKKPYNSERLEFLGDAVFDLIVGEFLFFKFQKHSEGELSKLRAALVSEKSFAKIALNLELGKYIFKPTPSIFLAQQTMDKFGKNAICELKGRHDSCVGVRGSVVCTAMARLVIADALLLNASATLQRLKRAYFYKA